MAISLALFSIWRAVKSLGTYIHTNAIVIDEAGIF